MAIEAFLHMKDMENMMIEYDTEQKAKSKISTIRAFRTTNKLNEVIDVLRNGKCIYVVRLKKGDIHA